MCSPEFPVWRMMGCSGFVSGIRSTNSNKHAEVAMIRYYEVVETAFEVARKGVITVCGYLNVSRLALSFKPRLFLVLLTTLTSIPKRKTFSESPNSGFIFNGARMNC